MTMPNFLIIGAPKAGTTTFHYALDQHPEIFMCPVKEAGFFWAYGEDIHLQGPGAEKLRNRLVVDLDQYQALFKGIKAEKAIGESSVRYLRFPRSPELVHQFIPQAKLIVSLRQPADRAFSQFTHYSRDGFEPCSNFADAVAQEMSGKRADWDYLKYLDGGFYAAALNRYLKFFDRKQLHISLLEDLRDEPLDLMRSLFDFLEVDNDFVPDMSTRHNASGVIRNPVLRFTWTHTNRLRAAIRPILGSRFRHEAFEWVIRDMEKPPFPPELRTELTEYYRQDIVELQDIIQRDLSGWL